MSGTSFKLLQVPGLGRCLAAEGQHVAPEAGEKKKLSVQPPRPSRKRMVQIRGSPKRGRAQSKGMAGNPGFLTPRA